MPATASSLRRFLFVPVNPANQKDASPLAPATTGTGDAGRAEPGGNSEAAAVSSFITIQSLGNFAVAASVIRVIWGLVQHAGIWKANSDWWAFGLCAVFAVWQWALSVTTPPKMKTRDKISTFGIAVVNAGLLAAAVIGIDQKT